MSERKAEPDHLIRVRGLNKSFNGRRVLKDIQLDIPRGKTSCIIGTSGSGKSTLMRLLTGLGSADSGEIIFDGQDIVTLGNHGLELIRRDVGMVFQYSALLGSMSIFDNIALPLIEARKFSAELKKLYTDTYIRDRVNDCLRIVRLLGFETYLPAELSGGMRKRAGMARAIVAKPKVIFYDEPTSGLDPVISAMIHALIAELSQSFGVTNIVITHDLKKSFEIADRVAMIFDGTIVFSGSVTEFEACTHPAVQQLLTGDLQGPLTSHETLDNATQFKPSETQKHQIDYIRRQIEKRRRELVRMDAQQAGIILPVFSPLDKDDDLNDL
ncbi:MAG: ATP-binding cassette domain-containing protein [Planctomycetota bacterium]